MTKEQAYEFIGQSIKSDVDMAKVADALKVIEQPSTEVEADDCISRKDVINQIFYSSDNNCDVVLSTALMDRINKLPTVYPKSDILKRIEQIISDDWEKGYQHSETVTRIKEVLNGEKRSN